VQIFKTPKNVIRPLLGLAATVVAVAALAPAGASAAVTIGSDLSATANTNLCSAGEPCTYSQYSLPGRQVTSPVDGVAVRWRIKSGSAGGAVRLRVLKPAGGTTFTGAGTSDAGTTVAGVSPYFAARLPLKAGDYIGVDNASSALIFSSVAPGGSVMLGWRNPLPGLPDGSTQPANVNQAWELLLQADIEADGDGDGYGDETQDACPLDPTAHVAPCPTPTTTGGGGTTQPGTTADTTAPMISGVAVIPSRFVVGRESTATGAKRRPRAAVGTTIAYSLTENAAVKLTIEQALPGRKARRSCARLSRRNRKARKCTRYKRRGELVRSGGQGDNAVPFSGRIGKRRLPPGKYRVTIVATDAAGNASQPGLARFTILAPGKGKQK
jgi:hypothetical protein